MTGKDLIIYILTNDLVNEPIFKDGKFIGFVTDVEVAAKLCVGVATVHAMFELKKIPGIKIGETIYIFGDYEKRLRGEYEQIKEKDE